MSEKSVKGLKGEKAVTRAGKPALAGKPLDRLGTDCQWHIDSRQGRGKMVGAGKKLGGGACALAPLRVK